MEISPAAKKKAIIAYITIVGLFIAISMNSDKKDEFTVKHIKNMTGITILWVISQICTFYVNPYFGDSLFLLSLVATIYSLILATQSKEPNIPFFSRKFQEWFTFLD